MMKYMAKKMRVKTNWDSHENTWFKGKPNRITQHQQSANHHPFKILQYREEVLSKHEEVQIKKPVIWISNTKQNNPITTSNWTSNWWHWVVYLFANQIKIYNKLPSNYPMKYGFGYQISLFNLHPLLSLTKSLISTIKINHMKMNDQLLSIPIKIKKEKFKKIWT
jgi:uncharacterized membrane protein